MIANDASAGARRRELSAAWRPLLACAVGIGLGFSPVPTFTMGLFAVALNDAFGWSRAEVLGAVVFTTLSLLLVGPMVGRLADRYSARTVAIVSMLAYGLSMAALALIRQPLWTFYLGWIVVSVVSLGTFPLTFAKIISAWFDKARGLALGIALCSTGVVGFAGPWYVQWLISTFGWRWAYVGLAAPPLLIALPIMLRYLREPERRSSHAVRIAEEGVEVREALRDRRYWVMALAAVAVGTALGGVISNLVPMLVDRGLTPAEAAAYFSLVGLSVIGGRLAAGALLDRWWAPRVAALFLAAPALACALLANGVSSGLALTVSIVLTGLAGGAEFDIVAYLTSRYFGRRNFGSLYAGQYAIFAVGSGTSPALFGLAHDALGGYTAILYVAGLLFLTGAALLLTLGRYPTWPVPQVGDVPLRATS